MPRLTYFVVDAFTKRLFTGNPAAVVPLTEWPDDRWLQNVAHAIRILTRATELIDADKNPQHVNSYDVSLAAYLWILIESRSHHKNAMLQMIEKAHGLWWAKRMAGRAGPPIPSITSPETTGPENKQIVINLAMPSSLQRVSWGGQRSPGPQRILHT